MPEVVEVTMDLTNQKVRFSGTAGSNPAILCDYSPPLGDGMGYTGLQLLLMSLAACSATSVVALLKKMRKSLTGFHVDAKGLRREEHPTSFESISLDFTVNSPDAGEADVRKVIQLSEESVCPVWAMLKNSVEIKTEFRIIKD